jgi:hypothetical protein
MAPSGQTAQPVDVMAGLKWAGYCGSTDLPLTWSGCSAETYWETLAQRYGNLPSLPGDESPDWVKGRLQLAQLYYLGFATGNYRVVQSGVELAPFAYSLDSEATTTTQVRAVLQGPLPWCSPVHFCANKGSSNMASRCIRGWRSRKQPLLLLNWAVIKS